MARVLAAVVAAVALVTIPARAAELDIPALLEKARPAVVHLSIRDTTSGKEISTGSGFVIAASGTVATNFHVAEDAERMVAVFANGREVEVLGAQAYDEDADVALLQLAPGRYTPLPLAAEAARPGDPIMVVGSPLGLGHSVSTGIVAAVREHGTKRRDDEKGKESWGLQITAAVAPGSSGSPILNAAGEVVGVVVGMAGGQAVYFGVPVARLTQLAGKKRASPIPLREAGGRAVGWNLLISAAVLGGPVLAFWLYGLWSERRARARERDVPRWRVP